MEHPQLSAIVENYITTSKWLSFAADYCNEEKHGSLNKPPRLGMESEISGLNINIDPTPRGFVTSANLEFRLGQERIQSLKLAENCISDWDEFLKIHKIDTREQ